MANKPIFFDATGRRAARASLIGWIVALISLPLGAVFAFTLFSLVNVTTTVRLPGKLTAINTRDLEKKAKAPGLVRAAARLGAEAEVRREDIARQRRIRNERGLTIRPLASILRPQGDRPLSIAFYPSWQPGTAYPALMSALPRLDWVMPTWLALQGPDRALKSTLDPRLLAELRSKKSNLAILPVIQNAEKGKWNGPGLVALLGDDARSNALLNSIMGFVGGNKLQGVTIDFEEIPAGQHASVEAFLKKLSAAFAPHGWIVVMAAPFDDADWPYAAYAGLIDYTLLMAYDQHDDTGGSGSIAAQDWFENTLDARMRTLAPSRTIVAIGSYAYDWNGGGAEDLSYVDAVVAAHDSEATIDFDDATNNPHFSYIEDDHVRHDVWMLDGVTAFNQIHASDIYRPAGYALWRLGSEDPSLWSVMGRPYGAAVPDGLRTITLDGDIDTEGQGEFIRVGAEPSPGARKLEIDPQTGDIDDEVYTSLPTNYVIRQFGYVPGKIALTFDDGPDPEWTPQILDILKAKHVRATFFIIGANAEANPDLVQRIFDEGHELGNHTYTHPNLADTP